MGWYLLMALYLQGVEILIFPKLKGLICKSLGLVDVLLGLKSVRHNMTQWYLELELQCLRHTIFI